MTDNGVASPSKVEAIYDALMEAILSRELTPGTKLSEETIGAVFRVSRTLVRAAFNRLHSESLLEFRKNRGAFVASPSLKETQDVFYTRILLEKDVAVRLAPRISPEQCDLLAANIREHREHYRAGNDNRVSRLTEEFHLLIARMNGNAVVQDLLHNLITRSILSFSLYDTHSRTECGLEEHEAILDAFRRHDADTAGGLMERHLEQVLARTQAANEETSSKTLEDILLRYARA